MAAQDKYPPYKVTPGTSMLADHATRAFQIPALFVTLVGAATVAEGIIQGNTLPVLVGIGIGLAGGALVVLAKRTRQRHEDAIAARQAKKDRGPR